jgi:hypothetical protein
MVPISRISTGKTVLRPFRDGTGAGRRRVSDLRRAAPLAYLFRIQSIAASRSKLPRRFALANKRSLCDEGRRIARYALP